MKKIKIPFSERFYRLLTELPPDDEDEKTAAARLVIFINVHRYLYYVLCYNIISDRLFDAAYHKLLNNKYFIAGTINDVGSSNEEDYSIDIKEMALSLIEQNLYATYLSDKDGWYYILNKDNQIIGQKEGVMKKISKEEAITHTIIDGKVIPHMFPHYGTFIDVEEESKITCPYVSCFYGGGMGMGHCAGGGDPFDKNCSEFKDEEIVLKEWEEYERSLAESDKGEGV